MSCSVHQASEIHSVGASPFRRAGVAGRMGRVGLLLLPLLAALVLASTAQAQAGPPPVLLGTADSFAVLGGSTITNTGPSVINGDLGLHPGTSVTGFPPGTVNGTQHISNAVAQQAKTDLTTAYNDAAGRPLSATLAPDIGGQTLTAGIYRTGSVPSLGLTGNLTLDAQGDPRAVFIFQVASTLTTATASSVSLINGAQACNVFWQVGSSATLGTSSVFRGNILALTSISVNNGVTVDGRLLARNGAVTLINDTVTRAQCAPGTGPGTGPGPGPGPGGPGPGGTGPGGTGPGTGTGPGGGPGSDTTGPIVRVIGPPGVVVPPGVRVPLIRTPGVRRPRGRAVCTTRDFTARIRVRDRSGIRRVNVYLDGRLVRRTRLTRFSLRIRVRGLRVGSHRITVVARDRAGNRSVTRRRFGRCALGFAVPRFTG